MHCAYKQGQYDKLAGVYDLSPQEASKLGAGWGSLLAAAENAKSILDDKKEALQGTLLAIKTLNRELQTADKDIVLKSSVTSNTTTNTGSVNAGHDKASEEKKAYEKLLNDQKLLYDNYKSDERKKLNANLITTEQYNLNLAKLDVELYDKKGKLLESLSLNLRKISNGLSNCRRKLPTIKLLPTKIFNSNK